MSKQNTSLFLRLWLRALTVKRPQAGLGVAAVLLGAALAAALLNLHDGVRRKMTQEFRAYGANAIVTPRGESALLGGDVLAELTAWRDRTPVAVMVPMLHVVMRLRPPQSSERLPEFQNVVVVGTDFPALNSLYPGWRIGDSGARHGVPAANSAQHAAPLAPEAAAVIPQGDCIVGTRVARSLRLGPGSEISAEPAETAPGHAGALACRISGVLSTGGAEDDQLFVPLAALQRAAGLEGRQSLVELLVPGETSEVERAIAGFHIAQASVRPVRAIVESQGRVLGTIRWLLVALTALILAIVALCVMATMTALVLERKKDVAVMKALGATDRMILSLFLCEGAGMGLTGGVIGFGLGLLLARQLGLRIFDVTLAPAWWMLPVIAVASTLITVLATMFPVRMAQAVQPATTLKGM